MSGDLDILLSYDSQDKPVVEEIGARLSCAGLRVSLGMRGLQPGVIWQEGLQEGVRAWYRPGSWVTE